MKNIHELTIREADLNSTNSRYDNIVAGASDHNRVIQWAVYSAISLTVAMFVLVVFLSILSNRKVRRRPFNLYLVYLIVPDLVFSLFCGVNCAISAARGDYASAAWCRFQGIYCVWGIGSNAWLNAVIARHVHQMLVCSHSMKRYFAPPRKQVLMESTAVYVWLAFLSSWPFIDFLPHRLRLSAGLTCLPHEYDTASTIFFWLVFMPCFALIPTTYALYVATDVWRRQLLPPEGRKRNVAVYFFRLTVVFLLMWLPSIFLIFIAGGFTSSWVAFAGGCWSHLQGAVSALISITKQDIGEAFVEFITCGRRTLESTSVGSRSSQIMITFRDFRLSSIEEFSPMPFSSRGGTSDDGDSVDDDSDNDEENKDEASDAISA